MRVWKHENGDGVAYVDLNEHESGQWSLRLDNVRDAIRAEGATKAREIGAKFMSIYSFLGNHLDGCQVERYTRPDEVRS